MSWTQGFIPKKWLPKFLKDDRFSVSEIGSKDPIHIDVGVDNAWSVYRDNPYLNLVINRRATMLSNVRFILVDLEGQAVTPNTNTIAVMAKLAQPNPLQSFKEWISQLSIFESLYANGFVYPFRGSHLQPIPFALWNLPSDDMTITPTGKVFMQKDIKGIIRKYTYDNGIIKMDFKVNEVIHTNNNDTKDFFKGQSRLEPLKKSLSNLQGILDTTNVLYNERGAIGMISTKGGQMGSIPLGKTEKQEIERQYIRDFGVKEGEKRMIVTTASLEHQFLSYPMKDLMLNENTEEAFQVLVDSYGLRRDLFSSTKGATFENQAEAQRATYSDTLQSDGDDKANMLTKVFRLLDQGMKFKASFDHLPVMQESEEKKGANLNTLVAGGIITPNEARNRLGWKESTDPGSNELRGIQQNNTPAN